MANFVLTEEQYNLVVENGLLSEEPETTISVNPNDNPTDVGKAVKDAVNDQPVKVEKSEVDTNSTSVFEGVLLTKKELKERRLERLRENSEIISVKSLFGL